MAEIPDHLLRRAQAAREAAVRKAAPSETGERHETVVPAEVVSPHAPSCDPPLGVSREDLPNGYSDGGVRPLTFVIAVPFIVLLSVVSAALLAGILWVVGNAVFGFESVQFQPVARVIFAIMATYLLIGMCVRQLIWLWKAHKLQVPYKAIHAAYTKYHLNKKPGYKTWSGEQLLEELRRAAVREKLTQELSAVASEMLSVFQDPARRPY